MQQGGYPSPFDRNVATKMACKTVTWLTEKLSNCADSDGLYDGLCAHPTHDHVLGDVHAEDPSTATLLGMRTRAYRFQPVQQLKLEADFKFRLVKFVNLFFKRPKMQIEISECQNMIHGG